MNIILYFLIIVDKNKNVMWPSIWIAFVVKIYPGCADGWMRTASKSRRCIASCSQLGDWWRFTQACEGAEGAMTMVKTQ